MNRLVRAALCASLVVLVAVGGAATGWADNAPSLKGTAAPGFRAESFITAFAGGGIGPIGVVFAKDGTVFVADQQDGFVYRFGSSGGVANQAHRLIGPLKQPTGLAFSKDGRHLFVAERAASDVIEVSPSDGHVVRTVASNLTCVTALATDPKSGDLFVSHTCGAAPIQRIVNPTSDHPAVSAFGGSPPGQVDGMTFGPDGTLFVAVGSSIARVEGTRATAPGTLTKLIDLPSPDGVGVSAGGGSPRFVLVNQNDGTINKVDLTTSPPKVTPVFSGGTRGDFVAVGPDGCLYATQSDSVIRIRNGDGSCDLAATSAFGKAHVRSSFPSSIADITEISTKVKDLVRSALVMAILVALVAFPAQLFNATLEANYEEVKGWFGPVNRLADAAGSAASGLPTWLTFGAFAVIATLLTGFLDPRFGFDQASVALFIGLLAAFVAVTIGFATTERQYMRVQHADPGRLQALPGTLAVAAVCVLVSRLVGFQPGYLYGIIAGFVFASALTPDEEGRVTAKASLLVLAGSIATWILWTPIKHMADHGRPNIVVLVLDALLTAVFVGGIESLLFGLIPLRFLEGAALWGWNRVAWIGVYALSAFAFVHILLHPGVAYPESNDKSAYILAMLLFVLFGAASTGFWAYFRYRKPAAHDEMITAADVR